MIPVHGSVVGERQPAPIVDCVHRGVKQRAAPSSGMAALP